MDKKIAAYLLASLLERIDRDQIGTVSKQERDALGIALTLLSDGDSSIPSPQPASESKSVAAVAEICPPISIPSLQTVATELTTPLTPIHPTVIQPPSLSKVDLVLDANKRKESADPDVLLCLDFGTAMSKAFAAVFPNDYLDLELGSAAGRQGYTLPSSVFISNNGKAYFGFEAIEHSQELLDSGRERMDSIKGWLSLRRDGNLDGDACVLQPALNPTAFRLTQGDLILMYLAYLTDMAEVALGTYEISGQKIGRYAKRRFARPCWPDEAQTKWAEKLMRTMLAEAQILADTFSGQWADGIEVGRLKSAIDQVKILEQHPDYLIGDGVPEPVAVAASAIADSENLRDAFMVVDVGAGTTDFGLFVATRAPNTEKPRVFQVPATIQGLMQAGDKVDGMLRALIARKEGIDASDTSGRIILSALGLQIRALKEILFKTGKVEYSLRDGTVGTVTQEEFLLDPMVQRFSRAVEDGFMKSISAVDDSWLQWLATDRVLLHVVLTGGSSQLPMMKSLGDGIIQIRGHKIMRVIVDPKPEWMEDMPDELLAVYPQLAVAIGGAAEELPETLTAPPVFSGGGARSSYVSSRLQISGT